MVNRTIERRLAAVERRLQMSKPVVHEVFVTGGLVEGISKQASIAGGRAIEPEPDEDFEHFRERVRALALSEDARSIVYGGLPHGPVEWAKPPGMEEALAKNPFGRDEIDAVGQEGDVSRSEQS
jgi:hypothetical protein